MVQSPAQRRCLPVAKLHLPKKAVHTVATGLIVDSAMILDSGTKRQVSGTNVNKTHRAVSGGLADCKRAAVRCSLEANYNKFMEETNVTC